MGRDALTVPGPQQLRRERQEHDREQPRHRERLLAMVASGGETPDPVVLHPGDRDRQEAREEREIVPTLVADRGQQLRRGVARRNRKVEGQQGDGDRDDRVREDDQPIR
jgi:hypothetical protein